MCTMINFVCCMQSSSQAFGESNTHSSGSRTEEKVEGKYSSHSLDEVTGMIRQTLSVYEAKVES